MNPILRVGIWVTPRHRHHLYTYTAHTRYHRYLLKSVLASEVDCVPCEQLNSANSCKDERVINQIFDKMSADTIACKNCGASIDCRKHICPKCGKYCRWYVLGEFLLITDMRLIMDCKTLQITSL